jgi:heat shock protein beta-11
MEAKKISFVSFVNTAGTQKESEMSLLKPEVILATSSDERFDGSNAVDGKSHSFWLTTGSYPQELIVSFHGNQANITKIQTTTNGVSKMRVEKSSEPMPVKWSTLLECDLAAKQNGFQIEQFQLTAEKGKGIRYLKFVLVSGYEQFACVNNIQIEGEEKED